MSQTTATTTDKELLALLQENFALTADRDGTSYRKEKDRYIKLLKGSNKRMKEQKALEEEAYPTV